MGVNNSPTTYFNNGINAKNSGINWGNEVNNGNSWLSNNGYAGLVSIVGATDTETEYAGYTPSEDWFSGYKTNAQWVYYDYGDAGGCPPSGGEGNCNGGWNNQEVYNMAWGNALAYPLPQVYDDGMGHERGNIANTWTTIVFLGSMAQSQACTDHSLNCTHPWTDDDATTSWTTLYNDLNCGTCKDGQYPTFVTNIRYNEAV